VYGDLAFGPNRPAAAKAFDEKGLVLYCSSFSKTLAPGYRIGWIVPGRYLQKVERLKAHFNIATASPTQLAIAEFLTNGGYDHHLRTIRRVYSRQVVKMRDAVGRFFPGGTRVTRPEGGFILWVEMPGEVDALKLYEEALREGISVAPGAIFTAGDKFRNCIRLNAAFWSERAEQALETVGGIGEGFKQRGGRHRLPSDGDKVKQCVDLVLRESKLRPLQDVVVFGKDPGVETERQSVGRYPPFFSATQ
ncbi:MAG: PLP-dependent aminotransferase family protein, partial [Deltaproteobacteria bacterium]|nr:PLP-dependent aminotransferase family protein [Deltaproteobacteria bacterium]